MLCQQQGWLAWQGSGNSRDGQPVQPRWGIEQVGPELFVANSEPEYVFVYVHVHVHVV